MLGNWKKALDNGKYVGAVLTDLSNCQNHQLLIAKPEAYGFSNESLAFIHNYPTNRQQKTKINSSYSSQRDIKIWCSTRIYPRPPFI